MDSAERASVQPATEFRHVQRHEHVRNVYRALRTVPSLVGSSLHAACATAARKTSVPARMSPSQHAFLWTRQSATAFNQPLSLDTSKVTSMYQMFTVRSARAHATHSPVRSSLHVVWAAAPTPSRLLALHVVLIVCLPFDSAVGDGVQPAAESRHVQSHEHVPDVYGAAPRVPLPPLCSGTPPRSCLRRRHLRTLTSLPQSTSPFDLAGRIFVCR